MGGGWGVCVEGKIYILYGILSGVYGVLIRIIKI